MKIKKRTLGNLRDALKGKIYLYFRDECTKAKFLSDAKAEGYGFGDNGLPAVLQDNIISLKSDNKLCYVGTVGRIEFQCNGGDNARKNFHRIDYYNYICGVRDFYFHSAYQPTTADEHNV